MIRLFLLFIISCSALAEVEAPKDLCVRSFNQAGENTYYLCNQWLDSLTKNNPEFSENKEEIIAAYYLSGIAAKSVDMNVAVQLISKSVGIAKTSKNQYLELILSNALLDIFLELNRYDEVLENGNHLLKSFRQNKEIIATREFTDFIRIYGNAYFGIGEFKKAIEYYDVVIIRARESDRNKANFASVLNNYAICLEKIGKTFEAGSYYKAAAQISEGRSGKIFEKIKQNYNAYLSSPFVAVK